MKKFLAFLVGLICATALPLPSAQAQTNSYKQTNLVSDTTRMAAKRDSKLVNPWGIAFVPNNPFWISDNNSSFITLYDQTGASQGSFSVAPPMGSSNPATPTGIVAPPSGVAFNVNGSPAVFIYDTEDGTISGWTGGNPTILVVDNSAVPSAATGAFIDQMKDQNGVVITKCLLVGHGLRRRRSFRRCQHHVHHRGLDQ
jgi:hypothetical protein